MSTTERTYIMVKVRWYGPESRSSSDLALAASLKLIYVFLLVFQPDGVQRGLVGKIISRFEERGYKIVALKIVQPTEEHLRKRKLILIDHLRRS